LTNNNSDAIDPPTNDNSNLPDVPVIVEDQVAPPAKRMRTIEKAVQYNKSLTPTTFPIDDYCSVGYVQGTSNVVERLFSKSRLILTDHRKSMQVSTFEAILWLKCNADAWGIQTVHSVVLDADNPLIDNPVVNVPLDIDNNAIEYIPEEENEEVEEQSLQDLIQSYLLDDPTGI